MVTKLIYDFSPGFTEDFAAVERNGKCGYVDKKGKVVIPLTYDGMYSFSEGLAKVRIGDDETGVYSFIDKKLPVYYK